MDFLSNKWRFAFPLIAIPLIIVVLVIIQVRNSSDNTGSNLIAKSATPKSIGQEKDIQKNTDATSQVSEKQEAAATLSAKETPLAPAKTGASFDKLVADLKLHLNNKDSVNIKETISELAKLGSGVIPQIQKLLQDPTTSFKMKAELIKLLGQIGGDQAVYALLDELAKNTNPIIQFHSSRAIYTATGGQIEPFLKKEMQKKDNYTVIAALLKVAGELKDPEIITNLNLMMADDSASMEARTAAAKFLGQEGLRFLEQNIGDPSFEEFHDDMLKSIQAMESPEALDALMRLTTSNVSEDTRKEIYSAISELIGTLSENDKLDKEKLAAIESELTQNLIKAEGAEVGNISDALSSINQDSVRNTLREEIARRSDVSQRLALASALAGNYSAFDLEMPAEQSNYLMEMTKEYASSRYDEEIRIKAISLLRTIGGDQSIEFLQTLSNDSNLRIRSLANKLIKS